MEEAIQTVVKVFLKSGKGKESLGPKDFQNLVKSQLCNILSDTDSKEAVQNMGKGLDANKDGKVGFEEYMNLVGYLAQSVSEQRCRANDAQPAQNAQNTAAENATPENAAPKAETQEVNLEANADGKMEGKVEVKNEVEEKKDEKEEEVEKPADVTSPSVKLTSPSVEVTSLSVEVTSPSVEVEVEEEITVAKETEKMVEDAAEKMAGAADVEAEKKPEESATS
ncbi:S100 calcium binding protein U [Phyllopteryx taeniolatus]|uniref:S100 calcium binding protein U n=1 Tax=Phyllopteryx taeniolatus TaxID=161469 RepID=UPI002AD3643C|nr:S100 calcium binding protein U [Phyllopteryx taeniolatus]XP_061616753.1 S100 calcium binding protein U [Phyllopteryx taeniolatus]